MWNVPIASLLMDDLSLTTTREATVEGLHMFGRG